MANQRAGQKRKVIEVPRRRSDVSATNGALESLDLNGTLGDLDQDSASEPEAVTDDEEDGLSDVRSSDEGFDSEDIDGSEDLSPTGDEDEGDNKANYTLTTDANGNERYLYSEIDPVYDSDDSDAAIAPNTIGNIPLSYYDAYPHIGYDINGKRISRPAKGEALDSLLDSIDLPKGWTGLTDPATGQPLKLNKEELEVLRKLTRHEAPGDGYDPYPDMVEWFTGKGKEMIMPLSGAPEPKRRFVPSAHEHKRVMKMVKAIKEGRIKPFREPTKEELAEAEAKEEFANFDIWANEEPRPDHPMNIPAPKLPPPGYEESYHPPPEYLPDQNEKEEWENQDEEDRTTNFLPQDYTSLRKVPGFAQFVKERFERLLDLYLAPRVRRSKLNIDPESLLPKLPDPSELKPFPSTTSIIYRGHQGKVRSVSIDPSGRWVASGGDDGTVRVWELTTGHQLYRVKLSSEDGVNVVSWRPGHDAAIIAACCGETVYFLIPQIDNSPLEVDDYLTDLEGSWANLASRSRDSLDAGFGYAVTNSTKPDGEKDRSSYATWSRPSLVLQDKGVVLSVTLRSVPKTFAWHRRGDYFSTVSPANSTAISTAVAIHTLSKHQSQYPFKRLKGLPQTACFHPSRPIFFVATRQSVRIYDLQAQKLEKELQPGARWISSISLHPLGSHLLVASYDKRLLWHDLDLSSKPYKTLRYHSKAIRSVHFHPSLPLFADASDDGSLQIFHGKVVGDSLENATIVPLKVLRGHKVTNELGAVDVQWHPREAWCVSAGADGTLRLWT